MVFPLTHEVREGAVVSAWRDMDKLHRKEGRRFGEGAYSVLLTNSRSSVTQEPGP